MSCFESTFIVVSVSSPFVRPPPDQTRFRQTPDFKDNFLYHECCAIFKSVLAFPIASKHFTLTWAPCSAMQLHAIKIMHVSRLQKIAKIHNWQRWCNIACCKFFPEYLQKALDTGEKVTQSGSLKSILCFSSSMQHCRTCSPSWLLKRASTSKRIVWCPVHWMWQALLALSLPTVVFSFLEQKLCGTLCKTPRSKSSSNFSQSWPLPPWNGTMGDNYVGEPHRLHLLRDASSCLLLVSHFSRQKCGCHPCRCQARFQQLTQRPSLPGIQ